MQPEALAGEIVYAPTCQVCKKEDETLRAVALPFVVSVVFMTFRRAFTGVFCKKHRRRYTLLASLITSTIGWLGIPFGLVFTPLTLIALAQGGNMNPKDNFRLLVQLANKKLLAGDVAGAIRCLEESLRFEDDPGIRERLLRLYQTNRPEALVNPPSPFGQLARTATVLTASALAGILIGLFDLILADILSPILESSSLFVGIASWFPFTIPIFLGILWIRSLIGWTITKGKLSSATLGLIFPVVVTTFAFYNIVEAQALARNASNIAGAFGFSSNDGVFAIRSLLSWGGIQLLVNNYQYNDLAGVIFMALFFGGGALCLYVGIQAGLKTSRWQARLAQARASLTTEGGISAAMAWFALGSAIVVPLFAILLLFPGRLVNVEDAFIHYNMASSLGDAYKFDEALMEYQRAAQIWPNSVTTHAGLGVGYLGKSRFDEAFTEIQAALEIDPGSLGGNLFMAYVNSARGDYDQAIENLQIVADAQPNWGMTHALLAIFYYQTGQTDLIENELNLAISLAEGDSQTTSMIANYYYGVNEFDKAEEYLLKAIELANDPGDYVDLTRVYVYQGKTEQAEKALQEAENLGAYPPKVYEMRSALLELKGDLLEAEKILLEGLKDYPDDSDLLSDLSFVHFRQGNVAQAVLDARKALEANPYSGLGYVELAYALQAQGKTDEALAAAHKAALHYPTYDRAHYILGLCYMDKGMKAEAIKEFEAFFDFYYDRVFVRDDKAKAEQYLDQLR